MAEVGEAATPGATPNPTQQTFRTADVARVLRVPPRRVRELVRSGICHPGRRGRLLEFSFQDLVLMRAAQSLLKSRVPPRRVRQALRAVGGQLAPGQPLSAVRISADGRRVLVRAGRTAWDPDSGQTVFTFEPDPSTKRAVVVDPAKRRGKVPSGKAPGKNATAWFERGMTLEAVDRKAAGLAYRKALDLDPELSDAYINLGRLVHEAGDAGAAMKLYREALNRTPDDPIAHYDMALALEDQGDALGAQTHYHHALEIDPEFADAHFNLGRLLERMGRRAHALRHLLAYKRLTDGTADG